MEPSSTTLSENIMFYLTSGVAAVIIPGTLAWWVVAQRVKYVRRKMCIQRDVGRWHLLRFGPAAPLLTLIAFIGGVARFYESSFPIDAMALTFFGLVAFLMSMVRWSYASDPAESADKE